MQTNREKYQNTKQKLKKINHDLSVLEELISQIKEIENTETLLSKIK